MSSEDSAVTEADALRSAIAHHQAGRLAQAARAYRGILEREPRNANALQLLGVVCHQQGDHVGALELIDRAIALDADVAGFHNNRGEALRALGRLGEAVASFRRAIELAPGDADPRSNLGTALQQMGRTDEAIAILRGVLELNPRSVEACYNLGNALAASAQLDEAADAYRRAIAIEASIPQLHINLGGVLKEMGQERDAAACYRRAIELDPDAADAYTSLGLLSVSAGRLDEAIAHYRAGLERRRALVRRDALEPTFWQTTRAKLAHDLEQLRYLLRHDLIDAAHERTVQAYDAALDALDPSLDAQSIVALPRAVRQPLAPVYNRLLHYAPPQRLDTPALNPALDRAALEAQYRQNEPGILYVDDFLSADALDAIRRFCLESTIWFKFDFANAYVAAVMDEGFLCPLLAQIAEELPRALPGIFAEHGLTQMWAFKYDSASRGGVNLHADFAAVNVNFWITPDDANRSPDGGGLIVWDKEAPPEWSFESYNTDQQAIRDFLQRAGARSVRIPYRSNRAVIFNSDLFHRTDDLDFAPGYENRRVNVTMLYGRREHDTGRQR